MYYNTDLGRGIKRLRPNVIKWEIFDQGFSIWEDSSGAEPPTWEEVQIELQRENDRYEYWSYYRSREKELREQLDMLFHDIENGSLDSGAWVSKIREIKNTYPKPEGAEP
jgi:hypothetical protein